MTAADALDPEAQDTENVRRLADEAITRIVPMMKTYADHGRSSMPIYLNDIAVILADLQQFRAALPDVIAAAKAEWEKPIKELVADASMGATGSNSGVQWWFEWRDKLRALLDAPAETKKADR